MIFLGSLECLEMVGVEDDSGASGGFTSIFVEWSGVVGAAMLTARRESPAEVWG